MRISPCARKLPFALPSPTLVVDAASAAAGKKVTLLEGGGDNFRVPEDRQLLRALRHVSHDDDTTTPWCVA